MDEDYKGTELVISPRSKSCWQLVQRVLADRPLNRNEVRALSTFHNRQLAITFAEGRSSITGQQIRFEE